MSRLLRPLDSKVRAKRVSLDQGLVVEARTIGTPMTYALATENLSRTGLLLNVGRNRKVPYRVNTLLELTVDPRGELFEKPVEVLGKIVRVGSDAEGRSQYGVQIIQMENNDLAAWEKGVAQLEKSLPAA